MAVAERERAARAEGDVVHSTLAPLAGSVAAAALALGSLAPGLVEPLRRLTSSGLAGTEDPSVALGAVVSIALRAGGVIVLAAAVGALAAGLLQTRGYFGRASTDAWKRSGRPSALLALLGWISVVSVSVFVCRQVLLLHPADPFALSRGAVDLTLRAGGAIFAVLLVLATFDHGWKARARSVRLGLDQPERQPRSVIPPPGDA